MFRRRGMFFALPDVCSRFLVVVDMMFTNLIYYMLCTLGKKQTLYEINIKKSVGNEEDDLCALTK